MIGLSALSGNGWAEFGGLLILIFTAFIFGQIVPRRTHERELQLYKELADSRKAEAEGWKEVAKTTQDTVSQLVPQLDTLVHFFKEVDVTPKNGDTDESGDHGTS
jgi:hypothetical protein